MGINKGQLHFVFFPSSKRAFLMVLGIRHKVTVCCDTNGLVNSAEETTLAIHLSYVKVL